ncbi:hypothetical protein MASR1M12_14400 [Erysipelotrichia bacterium]
MTGFRGCFGGVSKLSGVNPDLTCLGKVVGGGMPLAVYGGRADVMSSIAPEGPVYQAGTLSGNPVLVAAGTATLRRKIKADVGFIAPPRRSEKLDKGLIAAAAETGIKVTGNRFGSMLTMFLPPDGYDYESAKKSTTQLFAPLVRRCRRRLYRTLVRGPLSRCHLTDINAAL